MRVSQRISKRTKFKPCSGKTYRRTLSQLVGRHHLHVEVFGLRLAPGLNEPLQHLEAKRGRRLQFKGGAEVDV